MVELREYQSNLIEKVRDSVKQGNKKVLMVLPTGGGKTHILAEIGRRVVENDQKVLALMHRRQLVQQMDERFRDYGLNPGIIMAGCNTSFESKIQIATIQTYHRRLQLCDSGNPFFVDASVVFIDEAHRSLSRTFKEVLSEYPDKIIIGVTATPCLASGVGMGKYYDSLINGVGVDELIKQNYLVPGRYYAPSKPDLDRIRTIAGDYDKKELGKRMNQVKLIGDVFENWLKIAGGLQTIVFAVNVKHSRALCEEFKKHGISAEHLDAHSSEDRRDEVLNDLRFGNTQVVCNVGLYTEGFDYPGAGCIIIARPTKSMGLWRQMVGRGLRPYPDKKECVVIDHGGCVDRLGFVEDEVRWSLDGKKIAYQKKVVRKKEKTIMTCKECAYMFTGPRCPQCGLDVKNYGKKIKAVEAELVEIGKNRKKYTLNEKEKWWAMLEYYRRQKGYAPGWSSHKYRERIGVWPRNMNHIAPREPDQEFKNYMKYLMIKWIKSKEKQYAN